MENKEEVFRTDKFMSLNILKKEVYTGSMRGMRYRLEKTGEKPDEQILVHIWPEPFCFDKTDDSEKMHREFPYSEEGKAEIVAWLNEQYNEKKAIWEKAKLIR